MVTNKNKVNKVSKKSCLYGVLIFHWSGGGSLYESVLQKSTTSKYL